MPNGTWTSVAVGPSNWSTTGNWSGGTVANLATFTANFTSNITASTTVTLDTTRTIGNLTFSDGNNPGDAWVLTRSSTNTLTLDNGASSPVIQVVTPTTISVPLAGSNGFIKSGAAQMDTTTSHGVSGTLALTAGQIFTGSRATAPVLANVFPNIDAFTLSPGTIYYINNNGSSGFSFKAGSSFSGGGQIHLTCSQGAGALPANTVTFPDQTNHTGLFILWGNDAGLLVSRDANAAFVKFPTSGALWYYHNFSSNAGTVKQLVIPTNAVPSTTALPIDIYSVPTSAALTLAASYSLIANQISASPMIFTGDLSRWDALAGGGTWTGQPTLTFTLDGTNTAANTISGLIYSRAGSGALAISKVGAGTWVFANSSANTYSGGTTISGGTLRGSSNNSAFGTGNITLSNGTLELDNISPTNTLGTAITTVGTVRSVGGTATLTAAITLAGSTTFEANTGTTLTLNSASAITGAVGVTLSAVDTGAVTVASQITQATSLTKSGAGTATLSNTANTINGTVAANAGTLEIAAVGSLGGTGSLTLAGSTIVRHIGSTGGTLSRSVSGSSVTGGFENTGNSSIAVSGSISGTGNNVKLGGAGTGQFNTFGVTLAAGANAFTKEGAGRWISTNGNDLTGTTNVSGTGTLMAAPSAATSNRLLGGNVTVGSGSGIQLSSDNGQLGKNTYTNLTFQGTSVNRSRIRIGGSAVNPTVQMAGNLVLPTPGQTTFDLSADVFKTPGTYTLVEFVSGGVTGGTAGSNIAAWGLITGLQATFSYVTGTPNKLNVTISKV